MNSSRTLLTLVLASLGSLAISCVHSPSTPTSPSTIGSNSNNTLTADQLAGAWRLVSIQSAGQAERDAPATAPYDLTLSDGRLSTRADCNVCGGAFRLSGQTLTAGPALACTRAACPTMEFENTYTALLSGDSTVTLSGNTLVLSSVRGVLRFSR